jgi:flagellar hook protein FlgE
VDIAQEFSNLITLQNAYQANSRVVTTENQILQQTVGLVQP